MVEFGFYCDSAMGSLKDVRLFTIGVELLFSDHKLILSVSKK